MRLLKKITRLIGSKNTNPMTNQLIVENSQEQSEEQIPSNEMNEKVNVANRTLMTRLYIIEQEMSIFEDSFPIQYKDFMDKIDSLRQNYNTSLKEINKIMTYEIDPEIDSTIIGKVVKLERDVKMFIDSKVRFDIISKRLQRLIMKLNILYNVSIFHSKEYEKEKVLLQLNHAKVTLTSEIRIFKNCHYILCDRQLKERIINLISYADYEIFKISIRNSDQIPDNLTKKFIMLLELDEFDYNEIFKAFIKDEISDLVKLLSLPIDNECRKALKNKPTELLLKLTYSNNVENQLLAPDFWNSFLNFETTLFKVLKDNGVEKKKIAVPLITRMNISIDESEVLVLPKTCTYLCLTTLLTKTHDKKALLMIKLLKNISDNVTYKEIYFLLLLFDIIEVIKNTSNELVRYIEKYLNKYPYNKKTILEKKKALINSSNKEYFIVFTLEDYEKEIITTLESLNIDFKVLGNNVLINSFYFNGLENVFSSLQTNTNNMKI